MLFSVSCRYRSLPDVLCPKCAPKTGIRDRPESNLARHAGQSLPSRITPGIVSGMRSNAEKARENRLRRTAERRGMTLTRSRRRDPKALDYGLYWLTDARTGEPVSPEAGVDIDEIERRFLT